MCVSAEAYANIKGMFSHADIEKECDETINLHMKQLVTKAVSSEVFDIVIVGNFILH